ncbi:hypothetical protein [Halorubrum tailed virus BLv36]|nr:hypothetical protein [Halorubrum tailed virus BLv36]
MSDKRKFNDWNARKELEKSGWDVSKQDCVKFNSGSETLAHANLKLTVAWYLKQECGYRIDTEVEMPEGEVDVLAWKGSDIIIVECETSPTQAVVSDKISRYVENQPPRECWVLNVNDAPEERSTCYKWVSEEIGL